MEKKMLISELGKIALILVLVLLPGGIKAQDKPYWDCYFTVGFGMGVSDSKQKLEPFHNWQTNFNNNGVLNFKEGEGEWSKKDNLLKADFLLGIEPKVIKDAFQLGFPINFYLGSTTRKTSTKIMLECPGTGESVRLVRLKDIVFKPQSPAFGISTEFGWNPRFWLQLLTYYYKISERDYRACYEFDSGYYSEVSNEKKIGTDWAQRFSIGISWSEEDDVLTEIQSILSIYLETAKEYFEAGISFTISLSMADAFSGSAGGSGGGTFYYRVPCPRPQHDCY